MQERQIVVKNLQIHYKILGEGQPFLILHGWGSRSDKWQSVAELLSKRNIQIIAPDLPGFGNSQEPKEPWNLDSYADWVKEFSQIVPELNKEFYLLGHSFGGAVSAKFSIKYGQNVKKLFLVSASCLRRTTVKKKASYRISKLVKVFSFLPFYSFIRTLAYRFIFKKSDYVSLSGVMKETYLKVIAEDLSPKLLFIKVPTIIIWGDKDTLTPIADAHVINKKIEGSTLIVIPEADHSLHRIMPGVVAEKILDNL